MSDREELEALRRLAELETKAGKGITPYQPKADEYSWGDAALIGAGKSATRIGQGMQQGFYNLTGNEEALAKLKADVDEENRLYKPLAEAHPIATAIGEALPSFAVPGAGGLRSILASGAIPGALEYGTAGERAGRAALGVAGAGLGVGLSKAGERVLQPFTKVADPVREGLVDVFKQNNIPLSVANETGNRSLKWILS